MDINSSIERFRPGWLTEMVGQETAVKVVRGLLESHRKDPKNNPWPNLMFSGPPGCGKSTLAFIVAKELYGDAWEENLLDLNASMERGIDTIREKLSNWCQYMPANGETFKLVFLDEADRLTPDAQTSLRRLMEDSITTRFILAANYPNRIIPAIRASRVAHIRFKPLKRGEVQEIISRASKSANLDLSPSSIDLYSTWSGGDARRALNLMLSQGLDEDDVEALDEQLKRVMGLFDGTKPEERKAVVEGFVKFMRDSGLETEEVLELLSQRLVQGAIPTEKEGRAQLLIAETAWKTSMVAVPLLQLRAMLYRLGDMK